MKGTNSEILVIDDELQIRKLLQITLESQGFKILQAATGSEGLQIASQKKPDLILLDLGLPDQNGHETLRSLREWSNTPLIILSVQSREEDIIRALDNGANDYLVKPFRTGELLARIRTALRNAGREENNHVIRYGDIELDLASRTLKVDGAIVALTQTQYSLLVLFARNEGRVLTHQYILREIWGEGFADQLQYLRVFVAQLRKKIQPATSGSPHISTISGIGYRFVGEEV
jgi:two-component system, OmpR family, KDP operon response regulator KdpE